MIPGHLDPLVRGDAVVTEIILAGVAPRGRQVIVITALEEVDKISK